MKDIISEDMLRLYVRNKVRKKLQEQGKISVGQGVKMSNIQNMTFAKCEIELPPEFKTFLNEIRDGRIERVKIDLYTRAMKYGIPLTGDDGAFEEAARDFGVSRWDFTSWEAGSEIFSPEEWELWQKFIEFFPNLTGSGGAGGFGFRLSDFPVGDAAGNYVWHQLRRAAKMYDEKFGLVPGRDASSYLNPVSRFGASVVQDYADEYISKGITDDEDGLVAAKAIKTANPDIDPDDPRVGGTRGGRPSSTSTPGSGTRIKTAAGADGGRVNATTATECVEKWKRYTKARVYIYDKEKGEYTVEMVKAKKMSMANIEKKFQEDYANIYKIIETIVEGISKVASYSGVPSIFCIWAGKFVKYLAKVLDYFYEPQEATRWREIHDTWAAEQKKKARNNASSSGASSGFSISEEIEDARNTKISDLGRTTINNAFDGELPFRDTSGREPGIYNVCLVFPKFAEKYVNSGDVTTEIDDIETALKEDISDRLSEINNLKRFSAPSDKNTCYLDAMKLIKDIIDEDASGRSSDISSSTPADIYNGIKNDYFNLIKKCSEDFEEYIKNSSIDLNPKHSALKSDLKNLEREAS